jgi:hypothetical protein
MISTYILRISDNSTHTLTDEQLKVSNSTFAEVHEKIVICTVNNTITNTEDGDKSASSDDGTSKNLDENNRSHADRKHLTLYLSLDEKHNNEMGLTANAKVVKKFEFNNLCSTSFSVSLISLLQTVSLRMLSPNSS